MKTYNCVMLRVSNPGLFRITQDLINDYSNYIDHEYIAKEMTSWQGRLCDPTPHITLIYGLNPGIGKNMLYHTIKIANRPEYMKLKKLGEITIEDPKIDFFEVGDRRVLKINLDECNEYDALKDMMVKLAENPNTWEYLNDYHPHITLTYLTKDAPDSIAEDLMKKYSDLIHNFTIEGYMISSDDPSTNNEIFS